MRDFHDTKQMYEECKSIVDQYIGAIRCLHWKWHGDKPKMKSNLLKFKTMEVILSDDLSLIGQKVYNSKQ